MRVRTLYALLGGIFGALLGAVAAGTILVGAVLLSWLLSAANPIFVQRWRPLMLIAAVVCALACIGIGVYAGRRWGLHVERKPGIDIAAERERAGIFVAFGVLVLAAFIIITLLRS